MNYIWEVLLQAQKQDFKRANIIFKVAKSYSPYMELSREDINTTEIEETEIEINPYYRFYSIFKDILNINLQEKLELKAVITDSILHFLAENDLKQGLCKQEYYKKFILADVLNNIFGAYLARSIMELKETEKEVVLNGIISLYKTGLSLELFRNILKKIFPKSIFYINQDNSKEILIYIGEKETKTLRNKIQLLIDLFLNINYQVHLYWQYHFGILDVAETMKIQQMVLY